MNNDGEEFDENSYRFKIVLFKIDFYVTKPHLIYDETYSSFRKANINVATVARIFGSTDNGIKTCVHIHQYFPHFSLRQKDLACAYGIILNEKNPELDRTILDTFVKNVEDQLVTYLDSKSRKKSDENELFIVNIEKIDAFSFYGYHDSKEIFYKISFNSYWMANQAKDLLESGLINNYPLVCHNFLEFLLQFYVDNHIYLNELYFKNISFRKPVEDKESNDLDDHFDLINKKKFESIKSILNYNDLPITSNCLFECDALVNDIVMMKHRRIFPENRIFNPTLPGIIRLWNNQYQRSQNEFKNLLLCLKDSQNNPNELSLQFKRMKTNYELMNPDIPQFDGPVDSDFSQIIFQGKQIEINARKLKNGLVYCKKMDCSENFPKLQVKVTMDNSRITIKNFSKYELFSAIEKKIIQFERSDVYLNQITEKLKNFKLKIFSLDSKNNLTNFNLQTLQLHFMKNDPKLVQQSTPRNQIKKFQTSLNKTKVFGDSSKNLFPSDESKIQDSFDKLKPEFKWTECLNLTAMSLEIHARIREHFTPDPNFDPVQMIVFSVYEVFLKYSTQKDSSNFLYIGAIIVDGKSKKKENFKILKNKLVSIEYVPTECDLFSRFSYYVRNFDPDIFLGYIIDTFSWGYLLSRAVNLGMDIGAMFSRIKVEHQSKRNFQGSANNPPELIGRIAFNTWRLLRHELTLRSYSFENVFFHLFGKRFPKYSNIFLGELWSKFSLKQNSISKYLILEYYLNRVLGSLKILTKLDFIRRTFDLSCLFGMQYQDVIDRGTQFRVESMMFPLCRDGHYLPIRFSKTFIQKQNAPQHTPLIFEPDITFHKEPVAVLDFQSLYPSIVIANNYCFSTCLGHVKNILSQDKTFGCYKLENVKTVLDKLDDEQIHIAPNDVLYVKRAIRRGIMPRMLEEILNTRILVKKELKDVDKKLQQQQQKSMLLSSELERKLRSLKRQLDVSQLGLKMIANVTYGYTNANYSGRMPCVEIADSIVSKGRQTLEEVITFINDWGKRSGTQAKVIYGDTDSVFISFPDASVQKAFEMATFIMDEINKRQPYPMCLKLEKIYQPCIIMAKKRYCGYMYEWQGQTKPTFDAKGIETIRRDSCNMTAKIMQKCLKILFDSDGNFESLKPYLQWQFKKILLGRLNQLDDFIFAKKFSGFPFYCNESIIPACIIARQRIQTDPKSEPKFKERVPYVIVEDVDDKGKTRVADMVRHPLDLLKDSTLKLNGNYYIKNTIIPPLVRVFESVSDNAQVILQNWLEEVNRTNIQANWIMSEKYFRKFNQTKQSKKVNLTNNDNWKLKENDNSMSLESKQKTMIQILHCTRMISEKLKRIQDQCTKCGQTDIELIMNLSHQQHHQCIVDSCTNLFRYHQAWRDLWYLRFLEQTIGLIEPKKS